MVHTPPRRHGKPRLLRRLLAIVCLSLAVLVVVLTFAASSAMIGLGPAGEYAEDPALRQSWTDFILTDVLPTVGPGLIVAALLGTAAWVIHQGLPERKRREP